MSKATATVLDGFTLNLVADSALKAVIDESLAKVVADLEDRGMADGKARSLNIQLDFKMKHGLVYIDPTVTYKIPKMSPPITSGKIVFDKVQKRNVIVFNPGVLNFEQQTIDGAIEENAARNPDEE